jgi:trimeric autotransporter adhesin
MNKMYPVSNVSLKGKQLYFLVLILVAVLPFGFVNAQTTVFYDDFNRTSITPGGSPSMTYTTTNTSNTGSPIIESVTATGTVPYFKLVTYLSSGPTAGESYMVGSMSTFLSVFSSTLHSNNGVVTWSFNIRENQGTMSGLGATQRYIGVVLAASEANLLSPTCQGYMVSQGTTNTSGLQLVKFSAGLGQTATATTIITAPTVNAAKDWFSVKVTYDPTTNNWTLYQRTDGASATPAWADPSAGVYNTTAPNAISAPTNDVDYVNTAMTTFGYFGNHPASTTAFNCQFDNFKVTVNVPVTWTIGWPKAENATPTGFTAKSETNIAGKTYFVILPSGATAPSSAQVKAGQDATGVAVAANQAGTITSAAGLTEYATAVTGLSNSTTYDVYYVAEDGQANNLQVSPVKVSITTTASALAPIVSNPTVSSITNNSAVLGGNVTSDGGSTITERGTVWSTSTGVLISDNILAEGGTTTGIFTQSRTLPAKSKIFYKAYAKNNIGSSLSEENSFFTLADEPIDQVTNLTATLTPGSTSSSIDLSWTTATAADGYIILYRNSSVATTGIPTDAGVYAIGSSIGNGIVLKYLPGTTTNVTISGLSAVSKHSFTVFSYNSDGVNPQTYNYNVATAPSATATTDIGTAINNLHSNTTVFMSNGKLIVNGAAEIFNCIGMKVAMVKQTNDKTGLSLRQGVYIVKTATGSQKIIIQ